MDASSQPQASDTSFNKVILVTYLFLLVTVRYIPRVKKKKEVNLKRAGRSSD